MLIYAARKEDKSMNMKEYYDVIIVGTGAAGLYCALNLPERKKVLLLTKQKADQSDSFLAQGGICMLRGEGDYNDYFRIPCVRDILKTMKSSGTDDPQFKQYYPGSGTQTR